MTNEAFFLKPSFTAASRAPPEGEEALDFMAMPSAMRSYRQHIPDLPDPEKVAPALEFLKDLAKACALVAAGEPGREFDASNLDNNNRALLEETLGQGEVSIKINGEPPLLAQESVFAGVWILAGAGSYRIEVAPIPSEVLVRAHQVQRPPLAERRRDGTMSAPSILTELAARAERWQPGQPSHVINLSLLPHTPEDLAWLDAALGQGAVSILSRGYGTCRIAACAMNRIWRVQFFNSVDALILDSFEITALPEAALAACEDLVESGLRLWDVLEALQ